MAYGIRGDDAHTMHVFHKVSSPLLPVTVAFLIGILLGLMSSPAPWIMWGAAAVCAGIAWRWRRRRTRAVPALLGLWVCLGVLRVLLWQAHPGMSLPSRLSDEPEPIQLHAIVRDHPRTFSEPRELRADSVHAVDSQVCALDLRHLKGAHGWQPITGRIRATFISPRKPLRYGDELLVEGRWSRVPLPGNPGQYDRRRALARQRITGLLRVAPSDGIVVLRRGQGNPLLAVVFRLRQRWKRLIQETFEPRDAGILLALLLGERGTLDEDVREVFRETGTIHLLVISGFHVGIIACLLTMCLRLLGVPWRVRLLCVAMGVGAYCLLVGMRPPVVRATLMAWLVLWALAQDRVIQWMNLLAAAALMILWINPIQLADPGFQLSFGAVLSLLLFAARWRAGISRCLGWLRVRWMRRYVAISLSCTTAIWVGLWPMLAWYVQLISPVSILANLLVAPLISLLVVCGTVVLLLGTVATGLMPWMGSWLSGLLDAVVWCVSWCQRLPGGFWYIGQPAWGVLLGYYGLLILSQSRLPGWSRGRVLSCWLLAINVWWWTSIALHAAESRWLTVDILDVGHGDSLVIRTPGGQTFLVDAGTPEAGRRRVVPFLRWAGIRTVDALILTHLDADHLGGAIPVLQAVRVKRILTSGARDDTMAFRLLEETAQRFGVPWGRLRAGMSIGGDPSVVIQVLHPPRGEVPGLVPGSNEHSVVMKVTKGDVSVLFTGDLEEAGLPWLLAQQDVLASTVLKVPHHGSALGPAGKAFFASVDPKFAIISVGWAHHLPASTTVEALERLGARVLLTRRDGAIRVRTDGRRLDLITGRGHP